MSNPNGRRMDRLATSPTRPSVAIETRPIPAEATSDTPVPRLPTTVVSSWKGCENTRHERPVGKHIPASYTPSLLARKPRSPPKLAFQPSVRPRSSAPDAPGPSGPARAPCATPPDRDAYAAAGGPVDRNNPLTTFVVAGSRITIVRSVIGLLPCGQAQPFPSNTRLSSSAQHRRSSARAVVSRLASAFTRLSAARASRWASV